MDDKAEIGEVPSTRGQGSSGAISPTAHYTGQTWVRNGLSHPKLATWQGRLFYDTLALPNAVSRLLGGPSLDGLLLARHRIIDALLDELIGGGVSQVIEVACGMSPRGWRFSERYGEELAYVEADLPAMARRKREALAQMGSLGDRTASSTSTCFATAARRASRPWSSRWTPGRAWRSSPRAC